MEQTIIALRKTEERIKRTAVQIDIAGTMDTISTWNIDFNMPILKGDDRKYVDDLIYVKED